MSDPQTEPDHIGASNWGLWVPLVICVVYQSYRYPLQINSSLTSPTYSDTPLLLQAGKAILILPFVIIAILHCVRKKLQLAQWILVILVAFIFSFALFKTVSIGSPNYLEAAFWIQVCLLLAWASKAVPTDTVERFFRFLLLYAVCSNLIEISLFVIFGRLPALAYENSFSVRFGGFLDDPNGFAALLFLLLGWVYERFKGRQRLLIMSCLILFLIMTQSWTAIIFSLLIVTFVSLMHCSKRPVRIILIAVVCVGVIAYIVLHIPDPVLVFMQTMLESKQGSADAHMFPWRDLIPKWQEWIITGSTEYSPYESWWAGSLVNFGIFWYLADITLSSICMVALASAFLKADSASRPIYRGLLVFGVYFVIGSFSLPFSQVFPINVIFFLFSFLVIFRKIRPGGYSSTHALSVQNDSVSHL